MAEWSKAPDSRTSSLLSDREWLWEFWSSMRAWVRIPLLTKLFFQNTTRRWKSVCLPPVRLELTAFRLWDWRAAYCATEACWQYRITTLFECTKWNEMKMRKLGIEPRSTAWKAAMLTTIPLTLFFTILLCTPKWKPQIHICLVTSTLKEKQRAIKLFTLCNKFPWCINPKFQRFLQNTFHCKKRDLWFV